MKWITKLIDTYKNGLLYDKISNELTICNTDRDKFNLQRKTYQKQLTSLQKKLDDKKPSVDDKKYWDKKYPQNKVFYSAPKSQWVIHYLEDENFEVVDNLAREVLKKYSPKNEDQVVHSWIKYLDSKLITIPSTKGTKTKTWFYKHDDKRHDIWSPANETLGRKYGDCDDWAIVGYNVIRRMFKILKMWDKVRHRLKFQDCHVFSYGEIMIYEGRHANMLWLANDVEWYTVESTYYLTRCKLNFLKVPQNRNSIYGIVNYTANEYASWIQRSTTVIPDYKKKNE